MKTTFFFALTFALSTTLFAQDVFVATDSTEEVCNLNDLEFEKDVLQEEIQILVWRNEDLLTEIHKVEAQNQQLKQSHHSAAQIHLNQNLKDITSFLTLIDQNNQEMEQKWSQSRALEFRINSDVCQMAMK